MKIAILGGGFTGMTAAYDLQKKGHTVTLFEREPVLGGLAVGFKQPNWDWYLERAYHHLFANDYDILNFAKEIGFDDIFLNSPQTASLYENAFLSSKFLPRDQLASQGTSRSTSFLAMRGAKTRSFAQTTDSRKNFDDSLNKFSIIPLDSPVDLLKFPFLSLPTKIRVGAVLAFLKVSPFFSLYEQQTAEEFLKKNMGDAAWNVLWQELFRKKFGKYAENILASFIWARINKRTKKLAYIRGGFQTFIDHIEKTDKDSGVDIKKGCTVEDITKRGAGFELIYSSSASGIDPGQARMTVSFDIVISTLPSLLISKVASSILPENYLNRFKKLNYLHAVVLILETKQPLLEKAYWLNISAPSLSVMGVVQHTNLVDKKHYGNNHILYAANYVDNENPLVKMTDEEVVGHYLPQLKKINSNFLIHNAKFKSYVFKGPFAQPIFDREFVKNKPDFLTPVKNFFIANLDMTYPYDRGTNYAVKLGRDVAKLV